MFNVKNEDIVRIVILDITKPLGAEVYDEVMLPVSESTSFAKKYIDMKKYRIVTI